MFSQLPESEYFCRLNKQKIVNGKWKIGNRKIENRKIENRKIENRK
jgi:RNA binding exosome subunit